MGLTVLGALLPAPDQNDVAATDATAPTNPSASSEDPADIEVSEVQIANDAPVPTEASVEIEASVETDAPIETDVAAGPVVAEAAVLPPTTTPTPAPAPTVARIVDGDTVDMSDGTTIRLIGIDAPERGECGADEATAALEMIVGDQGVALVPGARDDVDRYGRLLRYLDLVDGTDVNLAMIESGRAIARYDSRDGYGRHSREDAYVTADAMNPEACSVPAAPPPPAPAPVPAPVVVLAPPAPVDRPATTVSYQNCSAVRAAGAAPIRPGDPGFEPKFDRDNDGIGCE